MARAKKQRNSCPPRCALLRRARQLDPEPTHAFQVRKNAERLFHALAPVHGLDEGAWNLLEAAAVLHDIGHRRGIAKHHKHSRDMILEADWPGLDNRQRAIVACIARYHRKSHPKPEHKVFCKLSPLDQTLVTQLAALLRIADGLDRAHQASVKAIRAAITRQKITLHILQRTPTSHDLQGTLRKAKLFEEVFDCQLDIISEI